MFPTHDCSKIHRAASTSGSSGIAVDSKARQQSTMKPQVQLILTAVETMMISHSDDFRRHFCIFRAVGPGHTSKMKVTVAAACLLCSLSTASAFSTSNLPWIKPISSRQNQLCSSLIRRGPHQVRLAPITALSMSLDPQLLKSGIAAYGVIIGAGGIVAGVTIFRSRDSSRQRFYIHCLFPFQFIRYQNRQQALDHFFSPGKHLARNRVQGIDL